MAGIRYADYEDLKRSFWETFSDEVGGLDEDTTQAIKAAMGLGLLRSWGFTNRLADHPQPVPIKEDDVGRYGMMILDGLLSDPNTRFEGLTEWLRYVDGNTPVSNLAGDLAGYVGGPCLGP